MREVPPWCEICGSLNGFLQPSGEILCKDHAKEKLDADIKIMIERWGAEVGASDLDLKGISTHLSWRVGSDKQLKHLNQDLELFKQHKPSVDESPEYRLGPYLGHIRNMFQEGRKLTGEAPKSVYILKLNSDVVENVGAINCRTFPKGSQYPDLVENPKECVYVGLTGLTPTERFEVHAAKSKRASKIAKLGFLYSYDSFEECGKELTDEFGFSKIGHRYNRDAKTESWLAWSLYKAGYWVWGSHLHDEEEFLGSFPYW